MDMNPRPFLKENKERKQAVFSFQGQNIITLNPGAEGTSKIENDKNALS